MIFVTVGTHEQPFNRLIQRIDELKRDGVIKDDVIIQTGFSIPFVSSFFSTVALLFL